MTLHRPNHFAIVPTRTGAVFAPKWKVTLGKGGLSQVEAQPTRRSCSAIVQKCHKIKTLRPFLLTVSDAAKQQFTAQSLTDSHPVLRQHPTRSTFPTTQRLSTMGKPPRLGYGPAIETISPEPSLAELGWKPFFAAQVTADEAAACAPVRVMAVHRGWLSIAGDGPERMIPSPLAAPGEEQWQPAAGDWLLLDRESGLPVRELERANLFKRRAPGGTRKVQVIAANVDTLLIVASCNQDFNLARIERYLVLAREVGVNPVIVLTKSDLADAPEEFVDAARGLEPGLRVELVNAKDPTSVAGLAALCGVGETVALLGSSGVGKSTLVNTLRRSDSIVTQPVREEDGKGRHTTTARTLHRLPAGGWLLDTPGMRELQVSDAAEGLAEVFDDVTALVATCRFSNCTHQAEPGCAVRAALKAGTLSSERLMRWRKLSAEDASNTLDLSRKNVRSTTGSRRR
jgi:ribosome biogenesis GTPase